MVTFLLPFIQALESRVKVSLLQAGNLAGGVDKEKSGRSGFGVVGSSQSLAWQVQGHALLYQRHYGVAARIGTCCITMFR